MASRPNMRPTTAPVALIYHDILQTHGTDPDLVGFPGPLAKRYKLTLGDFEAHLETIAAENLRVGRYDDAADDADVLLTFDDGGASAVLAAEMLATRGWQGHFFVTSARIGTPGFLDADGVRNLAAAGHAVGSHSHTHPTYLRELGKREIFEEWNTSREVLATILGAAPAVAAIPGGSVSPTVLWAAKEAGVPDGDDIRATSTPPHGWRSRRDRPVHHLGLNHARPCARLRRPDVSRAVPLTNGVGNQEGPQALESVPLPARSEDSCTNLMGWPRARL